jgi:hypothetical protein
MGLSASSPGPAGGQQIDISRTPGRWTRRAGDGASDRCRRHAVMRFFFVIAERPLEANLLALQRTGQ